MWVRSQDKKRLIKVEYFRILIWVDEAYEICDNNKISIATYSTEEKALKVLDMIEEIIDQQEEFKAQGEERKDNKSYRRMIKFVFQMPQDSEVE